MAKGERPSGETLNSPNHFASSMLGTNQLCCPGQDLKLPSSELRGGPNLHSGGRPGYDVKLRPRARRLNHLPLGSAVYIVFSISVIHRQPNRIAEGSGLEPTRDSTCVTKEDRVAQGTQPESKSPNRTPSSVAFCQTKREYMNQEKEDRVAKARNQKPKVQKRG